MENQKNNMSKMDIKNRKVMLYLEKAIVSLNSKCNNVIKEEKIQRAIAMFTNRLEDFDTIKTIIDWHVQNETRQYLESLKAKREFLTHHNQNNRLLKRTDHRLKGGSIYE